MSGTSYNNSEYAEKVKAMWEGAAGQDGKRWARPDAPVLHNLADEKEEPYVFFHNTNYRISRKYINVEKVKVLREQALECVRSSGTARHHKCMEIFKRWQAVVRVSSNVDRGPLARKRDVGFIYHTAKMQELHKQAAELEVPFPF
eukprot:CAMPEP_0119109470 /NCGR_PEP_ID=MMETSP1180-20130426/17924_1 /TAXON_ID=3052 ORGANISM="Chlamydomonas cf sp, Strain CCMP681" /NCGR_SAMPLE_ID=MMETSP1180 /ASSEMBLY_ACC=CAM_ASM_000741 /LENGTH=144 /DNA_ID=CAMNT_0007095227 /DNA_START=59 /DNA_END=493 /DNA_ORIENTATION=+